MKQFNERPIKREVQHIMFTSVNKKGTKVIGLAGNHSDDYKKLLKLHFSPYKIDLVDFKFESPGIINKSISQIDPAMVMDCDFCDTVINSGEELLKVFNNMNQKYDYRHKKVLSFTFSNRLKGGLSKTLNWLNDNFYNGSLILNGKDYSSAMARHAHWRIVGHNQKKFHESILISYRDTSSMLSGSVSWYNLPSKTSWNKLTWDVRVNLLK